MDGWFLVVHAITDVYDNGYAGGDKAVSTVRLWMRWVSVDGQITIWIGTGGGCRGSISMPISHSVMEKLGDVVHATLHFPHPSWWWRGCRCCCAPAKFGFNGADLVRNRSRLPISSPPATSRLQQRHHLTCCSRLYEAVKDDIHVRRTRQMVFLYEIVRSITQDLPR